jgi:hypothetical protein
VNFKEIETMFAASVKTMIEKKETKPVAISLLDPKRSKSVSIFMKSFKRTPEEVKEAIIKVNTEVLDGEALSKLLENIPTSEELTTLTNFQKENDVSLLDKVHSNFFYFFFLFFLFYFYIYQPEQFLLVICKIPMLSQKITGMLFIESFEERYNFVKPKIDTLFEALNQV